MQKHESRITYMASFALLLGLAASRVLAAPPFSEWSPPVNLGPAINSAFNETGPALSKDGLSLYFTSDRPGGMGGNDIWVSRRPGRGDPWGEPVNLGPTVNTAFNEGVPSFSRDGHFMFFNSNRPGGFGGNDVWIAWRAQTHDDLGWEQPVNAGPGVNTVFDDAGAGYAEDEEAGTPLLYFASTRPGGPGLYDVYVSAQAANGSWGPAVLVPELNTPFYDQRPNVRFDGLELFLLSTRPGGAGLFDLWVSTRQSTLDAWSAPVNLGVPVNGPHFDQQAFISSDRETLFFASDRPGGLGSFDLYTTRREKNPKE